MTMDAVAILRKCREELRTMSPTERETRFKKAYSTVSKRDYSNDLFDFNMPNIGEPLDFSNYLYHFVKCERTSNQIEINTRNIFVEMNDSRDQPEITRLALSYNV